MSILLHLCINNIILFINVYYQSFVERLFYFIHFFSIHSIADFQLRYGTSVQLRKKMIENTKRNREIKILDKGILITSTLHTNLILYILKNTRYRGFRRTLLLFMNINQRSCYIKLPYNYESYLIRLKQYYVYKSLIKVKIQNLSFPRYFCYFHMINYIS